MIGLVAIFLISYCIDISSCNLTISTTRQTKSVGDEFIVSCRDESGQPTQWKGPDGKSLGPKSNPQVGTASYGTWLFFSDIQIRDSGVYVCSTSHAEERFTLTVVGSGAKKHPSLPESGHWTPPGGHLDYSKPDGFDFDDDDDDDDDNIYDDGNDDGDDLIEEKMVFKDTPSRQSAMEHTNATIKCEVSGTDVSVTWRREDGTEIIEPKYQPLGDGLLVVDADREDAGIYICMGAQLQTGIVKEQKIHFVVNHKPYPVREREEIVWGYIGSHINLPCEVHSFPLPTFFWRRKYHKSIIPIFENVYQNGTASVHSIYISDKSVTGTYICQAKNEVGTTDIIYTVEIGERAKTPKNLELKGKNHDLLDVGVVPNDEEYEKEEMEPKWYNFRYRRIDDSNWDEVEFPINEENSYILNNLENGSEYEIKVAARNIAGLSEYNTNSSYFETLNEPFNSGNAHVAFVSLLLIPLSILYV